LLYEEGFTQNRELSWLRYNERVLEEALDESVPLFERLRFIDIFDSNLEDFFRVRVGSLLGEDPEDDIDEKSGMTAAEQLRLIHSMIPGLLMKKDMAFNIVEKGLNEKGIVRIEPERLRDVERGRCFDFFRDEIKSRLKITFLNADDSLPDIDESRPCLIADLDSELEDMFGLIELPEDLPSVFVLRSADAETESAGKDKNILKYVLTEDIVKLFADTLFVPFVPLEVHAIDIARNAEIAASGTANTATEMREVIIERKQAPANKLIADGKPGKNLKGYLENALGLDPRQFFSTTRIDLSYIDELKELIPEELRTELTYGVHIPYDQTADIQGSVMDAVKRKDYISAYPYDSVDLFLDLLRESAFDPEVTEIRITIYRMSEDPKITEYLVYAARSGKKVSVVLELRARFDEEKNIGLAGRLSAAGCHVYYGTDRYKVHSKMCQIVINRNRGKKKSFGDSDDIRYITQISTGNYNEKTAAQYTDLSLITYDQKIGKAASALFEDICREHIGGNDNENENRYAPLAVAPTSLRTEILKLIKRETRKGKRGLIILKVNSLADEQIMEALMEASCAGCRVRLIVRGICCMLPGIPDCTENICIVNRVDRFLEHSRVYIFGSDIDEVMYISSADLMTRNMDRRVEIACPVTSRSIQNRIRRLITDEYYDMEKGRVMLPDGTYADKKTVDQ
jgi:polyphosphate kinase